MNWFLAHLVGVFLTQTHWTASERARNFVAGVLHTAGYAIPFGVLAGLGQISVNQLAAIVLANAAFTVFPLARWFMDFTGKHDFRVGYFAPWSVVIVNNLLNLLVIAAILAGVS